LFPTTSIVNASLWKKSKIYASVAKRSHTFERQGQPGSGVLLASRQQPYDQDDHNDDANVINGRHGVVPLSHPQYPSASRVTAGALGLSTSTQWLSA
jgi:hypothetical protein